MIRVYLREAGEPSPVDVAIESVGAADAFLAQWHDRRDEVQIECQDIGTGRLRIRERVIPFRYVSRRTSVEVWLGGRRYVFECGEQTARRTGTGHRPDGREELTAPMPGTVLKVPIEAGAEFCAHQPLIIMESMKMELTLSIPHPGRIKELLCRPGQLVDMGAVLAKLDGGTDG